MPLGDSEQLPWDYSRHIEYSVAERRYQSIAQYLLLPRDYFKSGEKVLDVGAGFSDVTSQLMQNGVDAYAIDPIYKFFNDTQKETTRGELRAIGNQIGKIISVINQTGQNINTPIQLPPAEHRHPYDAHQLAQYYPKQSVDKIISYALFEHADLSSLLPNLVQVLKPNGEIRIGKAELSLSESDKPFLLSGKLEYEASDANYRLSAALGFAKGLEALRALNARAYVVINSKYGFPDSPMPLRHILATCNHAGLLIIRRDDEIPTLDISTLSKGLGTLYKINLDTVRSASEVEDPWMMFVNPQRQNAKMGVQTVDVEKLVI